MELDEYLQAIEKCPDELINGEEALNCNYGVNANWLVLLRQDIGKVMEALERGPNFIRLNPEDIIGRYNENFTWFRTRGRTVMVQADENGIHNGWKPLRGAPYKSVLGIQPGERFSHTSNFVPVIKWFGEYAKSEKTGLWFPMTREGKLSGEIVYEP